MFWNSCWIAVVHRIYIADPLDIKLDNNINQIIINPKISRFLFIQLINFLVVLFRLLSLINFLLVVVCVCCNFFVKLNASSKNKNEKLGHHHYLSFFIFFSQIPNLPSFSVVSLKSLHFLPSGISFSSSQFLIWFHLKKHVKHSATEIFFFILQGSLFCVVIIFSLYIFCFKTYLVWKEVRKLIPS